MLPSLCSTTFRGSRSRKTIGWRTPWSPCTHAKRQNSTRVSAEPSTLFSGRLGCPCKATSGEGHAVDVLHDQIALVVLDEHIEDLTDSRMLQLD